MHIYGTTGSRVAGKAYGLVDAVKTAWFDCSVMRDVLMGFMLPMHTHTHTCWWGLDIALQAADGSTSCLSEIFKRGLSLWQDNGNQGSFSM